MYYYKTGNTYVASPDERFTGTAISKEEYDAVRDIVHSCPTAPEGYAYRLTPELEWELYERPAEEELSEGEALEIILGGAV